jgi:molybdopterin/thiamine biosynthesis adenylyltransferase
VCCSVYVLCMADLPQLAAYGQDTAAALLSQRYLVVGLRSVGAEAAKTLVQSGPAGVGAGAEGLVTVTDVGGPAARSSSTSQLAAAGASRAASAAAAAAAINPELRLACLHSSVAPEAEGGLSEAVWGGLTLVASGVETDREREHLGERCVQQGKPLLESSTLGAHGLTEVMRPHLTQSFQAVEEVNWPIREAVYYYPHLASHCIEWAQELFQSSFVARAQALQAFAQDPGAWLSQLSQSRLECATDMLATLGAATVATFEHCVRVARGMFTEVFQDKVSSLQCHNGYRSFLYWAGLPTPADFSLADPLHASFMRHTVALLAANFEVALPAGWDTAEAIVPILARITVPQYRPWTFRDSMMEDRQALIETADELLQAEGE